MTNFTITINAPDLSQAINNLAQVMGFNKPAPVVAVEPVNCAPAAASIPASSAPPIVSPTAAAPIVAPPVAPVVPTTVQTYTKDQLAVAAAPLIDAGKQTELINLLGSFGVRAITELKEEQLGAFATALRGLGAKI